MLYTKAKLLTKFKIIVTWKKDILFNRIWITKLINQCFWQGKKEKTEKYFYSCLLKLRSVTTTQVLYIFEIMFMLRPLVILRWIRLGRKWHQVARPIFEELQYRSSLLLLASSFKVNEGVRRAAGTPTTKLFNEIINLIHLKNSKLMNYKKDTYSVALYNRSLFRFKW
jgi:ribosomal protein S7